MKDKIVQYIVVRSSLKMSMGKCAAQAAHSTQLMMEKFFSNMDKYNEFLAYDDVDVPDDLTHSYNIVNSYYTWRAGDYPKIVLKADETQWKKLQEIFDHILVIDNGDTELPPNTPTVITFLPMMKSAAPKLFKRLRVL
jgi:peptidyl-tRNA hydrolase